MVRTAIQLYTLRDIDEPLPDVVRRVGETSFDGVELYDGTVDALADRSLRDRTADALTDADLSVPAAHVNLERLESDPDEVLDVCRALDCPRVVVPSYDPDEFASVGGVDRAADRIAALADDYADDGVAVLYHNHTFEFDEVDGTVAFERFVDRAAGRFAFEPDVGLAAHAGYDPLDLIASVDGAAPVVHLTDSDPSDPDALHADPGEGSVDLAACADAAVDAGAEWIVCENGVSIDQARTLERGSEAFADLAAGTE